MDNSLMKKEFSPIVLLIVSIVLTILLTAFGLIHLALKCIYETFQIKFWKGLIRLFVYILCILYQLWNVFKFFCMQIAIGIDLFGNVSCGEAIEDCITVEESTLYGRGDITISTATGELEYHNKLNKLGIRFSKILSILMDKNHCIESYKRYLHNKTFKIE